MVKETVIKFRDRPFKMGKTTLQHFNNLKSTDKDKKYKKKCLGVRKGVLKSK